MSCTGAPVAPLSLVQAQLHPARARGRTLSVSSRLNLPQWVALSIRLLSHLQMHAGYQRSGHGSPPACTWPTAALGLLGSLCRSGHQDVVCPAPQRSATRRAPGGSRCSLHQSHIGPRGRAAGRILSERTRPSTQQQHHPRLRVSSRCLARLATHQGDCILAGPVCAAAAILGKWAPLPQGTRRRNAPGTQMSASCSRQSCKLIWYVGRTQAPEQSGS